MSLAKPLELAVSIGRADDWVDLAGVETITGTIFVNDSFDPERPGFGVPVVDLADVRELKYPGSISITGRTSALIGNRLEIADGIATQQDFEGQVTLPKLRRLRVGYFALPAIGEEGTLELPALETANYLTLELRRSRFTVRLPALVSCILTIDVRRARDFDGCVLEIPQLPRTHVVYEGDDATIAKAHALLGVGPGPAGKPIRKPSLHKWIAMAKKLGARAKKPAAKKPKKAPKRR